MKGALRAFVLGAVIAVAAVVVALQAAPMQFRHADWFDGGIRLLRDDKEVSFYFSHSGWIDGSVATMTLTQDYPPLGVAYFSLPRLIAHDFGDFEVGFLCLNVALYAALFALMRLLLRNEGLSRYRLGFFLLPAFLYFSLWRFDILPSILVACALLAARRRSPESAFVLLLAAALSKWYSALFFPAFFVYFARLAGREIPMKRITNALLWTAGFGTAVAGAVALLAGPGALVEPVLFHLSRDIEEGSVAAVLLTALRAVNADWAWLHWLMLRAFFVAQFAAVIPVIWKEYPKDFRSLVRACIIVLIPFMALGTVFSAQWIVWLTPPLLLVASRRELAVLAALDVVVFIQFPVLFGINPYSTAYLAFTLLRTGLFAVLWWWNFCAVSRHTAAPAPAMP